MKCPYCNKKHDENEDCKKEDCFYIKPIWKGTGDLLK